MLTTLRSLVIVWVALALPLKAWAVLGMVGCAPDHHSGGAHAAHSGDADNAAASQHSKIHGAHAQSHSPMHPHGTSGGAGHGETHISPNPAGADSPTPSLLEVKCSSCAPCCAAAAPAPESPRLTFVAPDPSPAPFLAEHYRGVVADVPHAPPRGLFA